MIAAQDIITRLTALAPALGEVAGAIELAALMEARPQPRPKPIAHVVPLGLRGSAEQSSAGLYTQMVDVQFAVFVTFSAANDPTGARAIPAIDTVLAEIIAALCGWGPDTAVGVMRLTRAAPVRVAPGVLVYAVEFAIQDQLRITP